MVEWFVDIYKVFKIAVVSTVPNPLVGEAGGLPYQTDWGDSGKF